MRLFLFLWIVPGVCCLHARGVVHRTRSWLLGWWLGIPFLAAVLVYSERITQFGESWFQYGSLIFWLDWVLDADTPHTLMDLLGGLGIVIGPAWGSAVMIEVLLARGGRKRRGIEGSGAVPWRGSFLLALGAASSAAFVMWFPISTLAQIFAITRSLDQFEYVFEVLAAGVTTLLGVLFGLACLPRDPPSRFLKVQRNLVGFAALIGGLYGFWREWMPHVAAVSPVVALLVMIGADVAAARRARRLTAGDSVMPQETRALRALVRLPWSGLWNWGARRRRWMTWAVPPILWAASFLILMAGVMAGRRSRGEAIDLAELFSFRMYGSGFWVAYLLILYGAGVMVPLFVSVPWRIAERFRAVWKPAALQEIVVTRQGPWDILWGIVIPPLKPLFVLVISTEAFLAILIMILNRTGSPVYGLDIEVVALVPPAVVPVVISMLLGVLTIGFARRRVFVGPAAVVFSYLFVVVLFAAMVAILVPSRFTGEETRGIGIMMVVGVAAISWAFWRAFARLPEDLQVIAGGGG